ncbi:ornithine carbamoyltransferase [Bacillus sp. EB106-08-02-XG196]|uniref:ornithine carbamoyltransferase n=1 Tax=Bacillus sp. EB106-08-02-XG196 TaxID=2737049 RepID=UPI0015C4DBBC|nr:ornithine carbamoyltransferase [Bacillus sp. EB106-08-02-XG196]NWQ44432.1 ornithine carbamoyltransferase [Bacillus sp. EB106-08-02-XG196]
MSNVIKWNAKGVLQKPQFKGKDFLALTDLQTDEILYLLEEAKELKSLQKQGKPHPYLSGKVLGMIFEKASTRTRVSFEVGMLQLGGHAIFMSSKDLQLGRGESISDTAKVLSRYIDCMMIRTFSHSTVEELAEHATVPVVNGLTDLHHPVQVMADLLTIQEHKGKLAGLKMCYLGDGKNNVTHSLIEGAAKVGMHISVASPPGYLPDGKITEKAIESAKLTGSKITFTHNPVEAITDADIVVTDVWTSMGLEAETEKRLKDFAAYQVNAEICQHAKPDYIFLHCLPAHRGEEVTAEIIDGPHSVVFDEAENRLHAQKAILKLLLE